MARALIALLLVGCASSPTPTPEAPPKQVESGAEPTLTAPIAVDAPVMPPERGARVSRRALTAILDAGPGAFLAQVDVEPELRGAKFLGWRVIAFPRAGGDEQLAAAGLRPNDIIVGVNDRGLERPEHLAALWQLLRSADVISVTLRRNGELVVLRWTVVGGNDTMRP